jgi:hypothetical protein
MSPLASQLMPVLSLVAIAIGLYSLVTLFTESPQANQTLREFARRWKGSATITILVIVSGLGSVLLFIYIPMLWQTTTPAREARQGSPDHEPFHSAANQAVSVDQKGALAAHDQPLAPETERLNIAGEWMITNTVLETNYKPYRHLRLGFRLVVQQDGKTFTGVGEKQQENGHRVPRAARRPIRVQGTIEGRSHIAATFWEAGRSRPIRGTFRLTIQDRDSLTGTFVSTAADARGASDWKRTASR